MKAVKTDIRTNTTITLQFTRKSKCFINVQARNRGNLAALTKYLMNLITNATFFFHKVECKHSFATAGKTFSLLFLYVHCSSSITISNFITCEILTLNYCLVRVCLFVFIFGFVFVLLCKKCFPSFFCLMRCYECNNLRSIEYNAIINRC